MVCQKAELDRLRAMRELSIRPWYPEITPLEELALNDFVCNIWEGRNEPAGGEYHIALAEGILPPLQSELKNRCPSTVQLIERNIRLAPEGEPHALEVIPGSAGEHLSDENFGFMLLYYSVEGGEKVPDEITQNLQIRMAEFLDIICTDADKVVWQEDGSTCNLNREGDTAT